jgi:hypothetical protein
LRVLVDTYVAGVLEASSAFRFTLDLLLANLLDSGLKALTNVAAAMQCVQVYPGGMNFVLVALIHRGLDTVRPLIIPSNWKD